MHASCVVSDSGSLMERQLLGFPAVQVRDSHERPEAVEAGAVIFSSWDFDQILSSIEWRNLLSRIEMNGLTSEDECLTTSSAVRCQIRLWVLFQLH